jgi:hypothetical protein
MACKLSFSPLPNIGTWLDSCRMLESLLPSVRANHHDGRLTLVERWGLTIALLAARARTAILPTRRRSVLGVELQKSALWESLKHPCGPMAKMAWQLAFSRQPTWLTNHCLRTHAWSQALGAVADLQFDDEILFAAAMLHDAGLTDLARSPSHHCFALRSARFARQALASVAEADRLQAVAESIARHLNFHVDLSDGVEAHLLQAGAMIDVTGRGLSRIPATVRGRVLSLHPRMGMKEKLCECMRLVAEQAPRTRASIYVRHFAFLDLIRSASFEE